ncbi:Uncharacterised protein g8109 [Pycnogonum litorale]
MVSELSSPQLKPVRVSANVRVSVSHVQAAIQVSFNLAQTSSQARLEYFKLALGRIKIRIGGLGPLGWILGRISSLLSNVLKSVIIRKIEGPIRKSLEKQLKKAKFP